MDKAIANAQTWRLNLAHKEWDFKCTSFCVVKSLECLINQLLFSIAKMSFTIAYRLLEWDLLFVKNSELEFNFLQFAHRPRTANQAHVCI